MGSIFKAWETDAQWLLPPSLQDLLPEGHRVHYIRELVAGELDLSAITGAYAGVRGQPPFDPKMMAALLFHAYSEGIHSSRRIAKACAERVDFMVLTMRQAPCHRTISGFRKRHLEALSGLFGQIVEHCAKAGLADLKHVALDGTKVQASASKHKAMSYGRMEKAERELAAEIAAGMLKAAEEADAAEDADPPEERADPAWIANRRKRLAMIRKCKAELEREAREAAEAGGGDDPGAAAGKPSGVPDGKAQRNFTDPDSRIMRTRDGWVQGYNAQAAVDAKGRIIVGHGLTGEANDKRQLAPMLDAVERQAGRLPEELSADSGYCSESNLELLEARGVRGFVATGRQRHGSPAPVRGGERPGSRAAAMAERLRREGRSGPYRLRKCTVEPVFGQIKEARGFRRFLLRGLDSVRCEWGILCAAHNIGKLADFRAAGRAAAA